MAKFCSRCGKPLAEGESCTCAGNAPVINVDSAKGILESVKNHMGIGDPELNKGDAYEKDMQIVPECISANEGEVPVKQYEVATLQNRILGIPYAKAKGKMQVTNKRVIFRAPGRCLAGRTTLQHEFAIDELAGVEARREYVFNFGDLLIGILASAVGGAVITWLINALFMGKNMNDSIAGVVIGTLLLGIAGCVPFVMLKKKWLLKALCLGGSVMPLMSFGSTVSQFGKYADKGGAEFFGGLMSFLGFIALLMLLFTLFIHAIKPNLVLVIKTKSASDAIDIRPKKVVPFGGKDEDHTGYVEVIPAADAERCIREINAIISDIQKLGDFGISKWQN
ncbi:MAG: hypothetical protein IJW14_00830 [Oscillospiraceae bacterium]|nr:hypothetical protein [Oscillospiraceae bacterium]